MKYEYEVVKVKRPGRLIDVVKINRPRMRPLTTVTCKRLPIRSREEALALLNNMIDADTLYGVHDGLRNIKDAIEQGII